MAGFDDHLLGLEHPKPGRNRKSSLERGGAPSGRRGRKFGTGATGGELGPLRRFAPPPRSGEDLKGPLSTRDHSLTNARKLVAPTPLSAAHPWRAERRRWRASRSGWRPQATSAWAGQGGCSCFRRPARHRRRLSCLCGWPDRLRKAPR